jgi:hypothetical protein
VFVDIEATFFSSFMRVFRSPRHNNAQLLAEWKFRESPAVSDTCRSSWSPSNSFSLLDTSRCFAAFNRRFDHHHLLFLHQVASSKAKKKGKIEGFITHQRIFADTYRWLCTGNATEICFVAGSELFHPKALSMVPTKGNAAVQIFMGS